jgi:hypothetical protein
VISSRGGLLRFLDVSDPENIKKHLEHNQIGILYDDFACPELIDNRWFVNNWHVGGFAWYDLAGERPIVHSVRERISSSYDGLAAFDGKLLVFSQGKYAFVEMSNKDNPGDWKFYSAGEPIKGVPTVDETIVAVSCRADKKVSLYDFCNPTKARLLPSRHWSFDYNPGTVAFWQGKCLIPLGYQGLLLEK